jgi:SAM-dependent methyltransferase
MSSDGVNGAPTFSRCITASTTTIYSTLILNGSESLRTKMGKPFALPDQATTGFKNASHYNKYRPSYSADAVESLLSHLGVSGQKDGRVIDLACGTGKFTELLAARPEQYNVLAIEPHEQMRTALISKNLENVKVVEGDAGNMPVENEWADALIAAQVSRLSTFRKLGGLH